MYIKYKWLNKEYYPRLDRNTRKTIQNMAANLKGALPNIRLRQQHIKQETRHKALVGGEKHFGLFVPR